MFFNSYSPNIPHSLQQQLERRIYRIAPDDTFPDYIIQFLEKEKKTSDINRDAYFRSEKVGLLCSCFTALLGAVSASGMFVEQKEVIIDIIVSGVSSFSAFLIGLRSLKKWYETWLRHRGFVNQCNNELRKYAYCLEEYESYSWNEKISDEENNRIFLEHESKKLKEFKTIMINLINQNNKQFMKNMERKKNDDPEA